MTQLSQLCPVVLAIPLGLASIAGSERAAPKTGSSDELGRQIAMVAMASPTGANRVTLAFDAVPLDSLVPFLMSQSGKVVTVDPDATGYKLTLISSDVMSRDEAFTRVMNKLRSDGLDVRETEDTIVISAGQYRQIWKPQWLPKEDGHEDAGQRSTKAQDERAETDERASMLLTPPEADHHHLLSDLLVWRHEVGETVAVALPPNGVNPNPLVVGDLVVASLFTPNKIVALDRQTGDEKWSFDLPDLGSSHVSFIDGVLYAKTSRTLYALDPQSGRKKWEWTPYDVEGEWVYSSPAVAGNRLYIGDRNGVLHCLSTTTGKLLWWAQTSGGSVNATAVVVDDVVITATNSAFAIAYATDSGREVWRQKLDRGSIFQIQRLQDNVVVQSRNSLYILKPRTGEVVRKLSWPDRHVRGTTVAGKTLVTITEKDFDFGRERPQPGDAELRGFSGADALFSHAYVGPASMLRFDHATGMVYESRYDGIGIIDPVTGRRIHHITSESGFWWSTLPDVDGGTIYALAAELHAPQDQEKPPTRMGVLVALRHP